MISCSRCNAKSDYAGLYIPIFYIVLKTGEIQAMGHICTQCYPYTKKIWVLKNTGLSTSAHPETPRGVAKRQPQSAGAERSGAVVYPVDKPINLGLD